jgi:hypothetical protein
MFQLEHFLFQHKDYLKYIKMNICEFCNKTYNSKALLRHQLEQQFK